MMDDRGNSKNNGLELRMEEKRAIKMKMKRGRPHIPLQISLVGFLLSCYKIIALFFKTDIIFQSLRL